uniref:ABC transporter domain-containing protein n=1 Tax=Alexandrium monilatum TaxID=311494 RepID=A0A7S4QXM3_9DINO
MVLPTATAVADALTPVLRELEVEEDMRDSLTDVITDAFAQDADLNAEGLKEVMEPFLLAFGASVGSIEGAARQVAVALCGLPEIPQADSAPALELLPTKAASADAKAPASRGPGRPQVAKPEPEQQPAVTLASFCTAGPSGGQQPSRKDKAAGGYPATAPKGKAAAKAAGGPPRTLGALWAAQADPTGEATGAWKLDAGSELSTVVRADEPEGDQEADAAAPAQGEGAAEKKARERQTQKAEHRAKRLAASEAAVNALGAVQAQEELGEIAAHGLRETREPAADAAATSSRKRVPRGVHVEGPGSRNVHLEGVSIMLTGEQGSRDVLRDSDLHLSAGHVYGLVGKNGSGKTTLLRRLAVGALPGQPAHLRLGYVAQELAALQGDQSALEAVVDADEERRELLKEKTEIEDALVGSEKLRDPDALAQAAANAQRFTQIEERLAAIDADGAEVRAQQTLGWLAFDDASMRRPVRELSGGWRMRLALARVLSSRPDILLLDEPTNHLDLHGVLWLQEHLRQEWGADAKKKDRIVVAVSHDCAFLDACATDILEIHDCKLRNFPGNYSAYLERVADEQRCLLLRRSELGREEKQAKKDLRNLKKQAREHADEKKVRQLKSKEKRMESSFRLSSMREFGKDGEDVVSKLREDGSLRFRFPDVEQVVSDDTNLLEMDGASVRQGGTAILKGVTLTLEPRSRVAVVGGNGAGKSTLMRALAGELKADEGPRGRGRKHPAYKPGFVSQHHLESQAGYLHENCMGYLRQLLPDKNAVRGASTVLTKQSDDSLLRAHLGNFGMGRDALKKVGYLSGGQKARLSLATATWWGPSALLLDEPTNHLDMDSLDALTLGLQAFEGPVVVVSHNRGFLEALCDELWVVRDGTVRVCPRGEEAFADFFARYVKECRAALK